MSGNPDWETPVKLFNQWHRQYNFTVDAAASDVNHRLPRYWTKEIDGLKQDWTGERVFFNPPYDQQSLRLWTAKAFERRAELAFGLLPSSTGSGWFHDYVYNQDGVEYYFRRGRIAFYDPTGAGRESPRYDNLIVIWHRI